MAGEIHQEKNQEFVLQQIMVFDGQILVGERGGRIKIVQVIYENK